MEKQSFLISDLLNKLYSLYNLKQWVWEMWPLKSNDCLTEVSTMASLTIIFRNTSEDKLKFHFEIRASNPKA